MARCSCGPSRRAPPLDVCADPLPDEIAAAVYFVVAECLTTASRYGQASEVRVRVAREDGALRLEVADDGVGGAETRPGAPDCSGSPTAWRS